MWVRESLHSLAVRQRASKASRRLFHILWFTQGRYAVAVGRPGRSEACAFRRASLMPGTRMTKEESGERRRERLERIEKREAFQRASVSLCKVSKIVWRRAWEACGLSYFALFRAILKFRRPLEGLGRRPGRTSWIRVLPSPLQNPF